MFWVVEYDNGYCSDYEGELYLNICRHYFQNKENAQKWYDRVKERFSKITDPDFENIEMYCEFFEDE